MGQDNMAKLNDQIMRMNGTLEVWDGKIRRLDQKMHNLNETAQMLEDNGIKNKKEFDTVLEMINETFNIPGIIGADKETNEYESMREFVTEMHAFKRSTAERMDSKVKGAEKKAQRIVQKLEEEMGDLYRGHEKELVNIRNKLK